MNSATAWYLTWKRMIENPAKFSSASPLLKARFAVAGLSLNEDLDTVQKVQDYANAKIDEADDYGIWREDRIRQAENAIIALG